MSGSWHMVSTGPHEWKMNEEEVPENNKEEWTIERLKAAS
jgi:hypothetical protein